MCTLIQRAQDIQKRSPYISKSQILLILASGYYHQSCNITTVEKSASASGMGYMQKDSSLTLYWVSQSKGHTSKNLCLLQQWIDCLETGVTIHVVMFCPVWGVFEELMADIAYEWKYGTYQNWDKSENALQNQKTEHLNQMMKLIAFTK